MPERVTAFLTYPDPRFAQPAPAREVDDELRQIGAALLRAAMEAQAYGLAAVHIGHVAPIAMVSFAEPSSRDYRVLYNPRIIAVAGPEIAGKEGSVSMPGIEVDIVRAATVRIGYEDDLGKPMESELAGFPARVAQHEIDQVNGTFFLSRLSRLKRDAAIKRFSKLERRTG